MTPDHIRPLLSELISVIERTSRAYQAIVLHAPGASRSSALDGWAELCEQAHGTVQRARMILDSFDIDAVEPPAFLAHELADRLRTRRALRPFEQRRPGMRVH